jgi:hypothetical protein
VVGVLLSLRLLAGLAPWREKNAISHKAAKIAKKTPRVAGSDFFPFKNEP